MIKTETTEKYSKTKWDELAKCAKVLGNVAYPRLKAGLDWKGEDMEYVEKYFAATVDVLRGKGKFVLAPPKLGEKDYSASFWKLYRRVSRKGLIKIAPPTTKEEIKAWNKQREKITQVAVSKTLFALDSNGNIADQFEFAPKFAFYEDEELKHELTNDISSPRAPKLLKICKKLRVDKVVAKEFGDDICDLFPDKGVELICGEGKPFTADKELTMKGKLSIKEEAPDNFSLEDLTKSMDTLEKAIGTRPDTIRISQEGYDKLISQPDFERISDIVKIEVVGDSGEVKLMSNVRKTEKRSLRDMIGKPFKIIRKLRQIKE